TLADKTFNTTTKGYTGHEQLDSVGLIHMGGRVYDPYIGRFLSPDEHVQYPEFTQSYNRYSYVLNNPLSSVDPTGESERDASGDKGSDRDVNNGDVDGGANGTESIGTYVKALPPRGKNTPDEKTQEQ